MVGNLIFNIKQNCFCFPPIPSYTISTGKERTVQNSGGGGGGGGINSLNHTQIKYIEQWYTVVTFINHDWVIQIRYEFILYLYHSKFLMGITTTNDE